MIGRQQRTRHRTYLGNQHPLDDLDQEEDMFPTFLLLVATLPSALGQCTTSKCHEQGYEPPRWENGAVYLESLLAQTSDRMIKAVQEALETRLAAQTAALEDRLKTGMAAQTAALHEKIASLEGRLTAATQDIGALVTASQNASCSAATRDIGTLITTFQNASSQMAECCGRPVTTASPTVIPSTTSTTTPSTTPTVRPSTTPTTTETPTTTSTTTPSPTTTPSTTPTTTVRPTTTPTECFTLAPSGIVFLRRLDGSVDFYKDWAAYKCGFGDQAGEFWLGLDNLHTLTTRHNYGLRADLTGWSGETKWAVYSTFRVAGKADGYRLTVSGFNSASTAGDSMSYNSGKGFSTRDRDNDGRSASCADHRQGAWWYQSCTWANPTGLYKPAGYRGEQGIIWWHAYRDSRSFKRVTLTLVNA